MDLVSADYAEKTQQIKRVLASQHRNSLANYKSDRDASGARRGPVWVCPLLSYYRGRDRRRLGGSPVALSLTLSIMARLASL